MTVALDTTLKAVADPTRREILALLAQHPLRAGDIARHFHRLSRPAVSRHLRVLREAGLVSGSHPTEQSDEREIWYAAQPATLREVEQWVAHYRRYWESRLDVLEDLVKRKR